MKVRKTLSDNYKKCQRKVKKTLKKTLSDNYSLTAPIYHHTKIRV